MDVSARHRGYSSLEFRVEVRAGDKKLGILTIKIFKFMGIEAVT